ncbi:uncharacterized protein LOC111696624 isoform X2 [Eurytemora carolleeae]|nr:uncharacterized protein LOC111696624 isoform X2 [Eurytemora carolleeae]|eukprot:XP_023322048.1 uncharacterized protein LOC111696624 isoform X2 [Eurytemora affinis]
MQTGELKMEVGLHGFVEYHPGNTNIILSIPHGGTLKPDFIKDRVHPDPNGEYEEGEEERRRCRSRTKIDICADKYTLQIGKQLSKDYTDLTSFKPHVILSNLHRSKLDPNRPQTVALSSEDSDSEIAYNEYHEFIRKASKKIGGRGLLLDIHGQNHKQNSVELGYLIYKSELNAGKYRKRNSSILNLAKTTGLSIEELLHGDLSFGALLEEEGYKAVPSPRQHAPGKQRYYTGGFITQVYGSSRGGEIDSIQIEIPGESRFSSKVRKKFSRGLAKAVQKFHARFYAD